jgi:hypothetical protein
MKMLDLIPNLFLLAADEATREVVKEAVREATSSKNSELGKLIADYLPYIITTGTTAALAIGGGIWRVCRLIWINVIMPGKEKAFAIADEFKDKHFSLVNTLETQLAEQTTHSKRQADAAEQQVVLMAEMNKATAATNMRVEQVARIQGEHFEACKPKSKSQT